LHASRNKKSTRVAVLIQTKLELKIIKRESNCHYIMRKGSVNQDDIELYLCTHHCSI
jgi:hypothetical protein